MTIQDPREYNHYYPELKVCEYQEAVSIIFGKGINTARCLAEQCEYFTPKNDKK